jgi:hypothetical protein
MALASSNATSDLYVAAWAGAVGADLNIKATYGQPCRAIRIGKAGALVVKRPDGTAVTLPAGYDGETVQIQVSALTAVGSAAHSLILLF